MASSPVIAHILGVWAGYIRFLRRPTIPARRVGFDREATLEVATLLLLDCIVVALFVGAAALIEAGGIELPQSIDMDLSAGEYLVFAVILAPLLEEWLFRAGLLGHRRTLIGLGVGWLLLLVTEASAAPDPIEPWYLVWILPAGIAAGMTIGAFKHRDRDWSTAFGSVFPYLFWLSSCAFALLHLSNYEQPLGFTALLMVAPLLTGATILAYVRVTYGMWANIAQHAVYNGLFLVLHLGWPDHFGL